MFTITIEDQNGQVANTFSFDHGEYVVGRTDDCDVVLPSSSVSRSHARIFIQQGRCYIEDLGSANGVIVDGQRVLKTRDLGTASQIRIGDYYLYLEYQQAARLQDQNVRSTLFIDAGAEHHKLVRINDSFAGEEFTLSEQENTIGRTDENFILLSDTSISRRHAVIYRSGDLYFVEDFGSSNGTRLNGTPVTSREEVRASDRVEFGNVEFVLVPGDQTVNPALFAASRSSNPLSTARIVVLLLASLTLGGFGVFMIVSASANQDQASAQTQIDPLQARLDELLRSGENQLRVGNWEAASAAFDEALDLAPQHPEARALRDRVALERQGAELLTRVENLSEEGRHSQARELILQIPAGTLAAERAAPTLAHLNRTVLFNLKSEANRLLRRGNDDLQEAHQRLREAIQIDPQDSELREMISDVESRMQESGISFLPL